MDQVVFWHGIVSPHMFELARAVAMTGRSVTYVAKTRLSDRRAAMGWEPINTNGVETVILDDGYDPLRILSSIPRNAVHLVEGVCGGRCYKSLRRALASESRRWGVIMEMVDEREWHWPIKRLVYRWQLNFSKRPDFILGIGHTTPAWLKALGCSESRVFPFAYFVAPPECKILPKSAVDAPFRIGFVGRLIPLKRVDLLIDAVSEVGALRPHQLHIVGSGPETESLRSSVREKLLGHEVIFHGHLPISEIPSLMRGLDCLVLPSDYDGWGAVVTEALMEGVPAIVSDGCGGAEAVIASGVGGVFPKGDLAALSMELAAALRAGPAPMKERHRIAYWARAFSPTSGASYLNDVLDSVYGDSPKAKAPWLR